MRVEILTVCLAFAVLGCKTRERDEPLVETARRCADAELSCPRPILHVRDLGASQRYYRDALGFKLDWDYGEPPDFASVSRGDSVVFLCQGCQGLPGAWIMMFTPNVDRLHDELVRRKAKIRQPPTNMPWGLREMQVEDLDGNIMRLGSAIPE